MRGDEGLDRKADDTIMELFVTLRDEASILAVKCVEDIKFRATSTSMLC